MFFAVHICGYYAIILRRRTSAAVRSLKRWRYRILRGYRSNCVSITYSYYRITYYALPRVVFLRNNMAKVLFKAGTTRSLHVLCYADILSVKYQASEVILLWISEFSLHLIDSHWFKFSVYAHSVTQVTKVSSVKTNHESCTEQLSWFLYNSHGQTDHHYSTLNSDWNWP